MAKINLLLHPLKDETIPPLQTKQRMKLNAKHIYAQG